MGQCERAYPRHVTPAVMLFTLHLDSHQPDAAVRLSDQEFQALRADLVAARDLLAEAIEAAPDGAA